jgi:hypothetical protein
MDSRASREDTLKRRGSDVARIESTENAQFNQGEHNSLAV